MLQLWVLLAPPKKVGHVLDFDEGHVVVVLREMSYAFPVDNDVLSLGVVSAFPAPEASPGG